MGEIFHIYASQGQNNYVELDLPASDYEMLDMMERLRLAPGKLPYVEVLKIHETYDYLDRCICWLAKTGRKGRQNKIGGTQTEGEEKEREANWRRKWGGKGENRRE